jgi:hypothetical protein
LKCFWLSFDLERELKTGSCFTVSPNIFSYILIEGLAMKRRLSSSEDLPTKKQKINSVQNNAETILPDDCLRIIVENLPYNMLAQVKLVSKAIKSWADEISAHKLLSDFGKSLVIQDIILKNGFNANN